MANLLDIETRIHLRASSYDPNLAECGLCEIREPTGLCGISLKGRGGNHECDFGLTKQETHDLAHDPESMASFISKTLEKIRYILDIK